MLIDSLVAGDSAAENYHIGNLALWETYRLGTDVARQRGSGRLNADQAGGDEEDGERVTGMLAG